jgi:hypothetical protein
MFTSCYGQYKNIVRAGLKPVAISRSVPNWFHGVRDESLAPSYQILYMPREKFDYLFLKQLKRQDANAVLRSYGEDVCLLCFEKAGEWCHRRMVAEWIEKETGVVVPEFNFRSDIKYCDLKSKEQKEEERKSREPSLFE